MIRVIRIAAILVVCILAMQGLHELGHALMARALGYDVILTINRVSPVDGMYSSRLDANLITFAGPLVTVAIAMLAFAFSKRLGELAPIILWNALTMRMMAAVISVFHPNDEAKLSASLGLGTWTLPILVCLLLLVLFVSVARSKALGWRWYLAVWLGMSVGYSVVVFGESALPQFTI